MLVVPTNYGLGKIKKNLIVSSEKCQFLQLLESQNIA